MKKTFLTAAFALAVSAGAAQAHKIALWPDGPAESNGITAPEERHDDWSMYNISEAELYVWPADRTLGNGEKNTGKAVLICPGGGYAKLAAGYEGSDFAEWFAAHGITAVVLKYRLPNGHSEIPLADARQAIRVIRENAQEWGIDPAKIGVIGFSAGGHLASTLLTQYDEGSRPDFGVLFYPVITMGEATHGGSRDNLLGKNPPTELIERFSGEMHVTRDTPPTMIFFCDDDHAVDPRNGTMFYDALKASGVEAALYVFPSGGHGWGFRESFKYSGAMRTLLTDWVGF